ncbi:UDP-N-acetylglucosamine 1-carboxyvinyltransferase [Candidatus Kaiserbacteria bacterium CG_4_9_14_0_2_um_filter_41_32]|uniref:UDP-N-acetylglucosamine 1-carboxyvinyltransferase n=1 Tax=Candidatus Kaiserbacteria bacterium CG_4_9_14_0_2_um_filter_41_32 TaxID=1974601 RepID=A0A2M8FEX9_9BACT|nr:MAG: UDP-N-acetylglucosamine 1-carboxyvinyltransferase [Candidatus Kaiserbacteria bacterium CG_4_9_14_0_2_um_filter_41_32]
MENNIGKSITDVRESRGMTQTQLAKKIKTTQSAIARLESGNQNISTEMLKKISHALGKNLVSLSPGTVNIAVVGGKKLTGTVETNTSKNGAVGLLCASLLNKGKTTLHRMPRIEEVHRIIEVLESIGVQVTWHGSTITIIPPKKFNLKHIDVEAAKKTRSIVMFIGSLIHHLTNFSLPQSGGCKLGSRTVRPHFFALENFGVSIEAAHDSFKISYQPKQPNEIVLYESGDTVTENAIFAATGLTSTTTIKYASANYMVQEVCVFLQKFGVKITGIGTTTLTITGVKNINRDIEYTLAEDPTDSMFFIAAAITTHSNLTITRCPIEFLELELLVLEKMGLQYTKSKPYLSYNQNTKLVDLKIKASSLVASPEKVHARPYPGLNADNLPFFAVIATQAVGQTLIHDWMYEKRAIYFTELDKLGAETVLADPHRIFITGPTPLRATELICPPALRPATILLVAMLGASGRSVLRNTYSISRGYENLVERLSGLGADISYLDAF